MDRTDTEQANYEILSGQKLFLSKLQGLDLIIKIILFW